jgi:hypothetical protein
MEVLAIGKQCTGNPQIKPMPATKCCRHFKEIAMNIEIYLYDQIKQIESAEPQSIKSKTQNGSFEFRHEEWLLNDLSGNYGALFIRAILHQLNVSESYVLKWRLENKYIQYVILNYYIPDCMPSTIPLSSILYRKNGFKKIKDLFSQGYFLKATLGDASYATQSWDKTAEFERIALLPTVCTGQYENYMIQKKICIKTEFRVHTFSKDIIPGLSYVSHGENQAPYHQGLNDFLNEILTKIPNSILTGTLIAWDIALTPENHYYVIEANFTGFHPEYRRGFQTSGYVDDHKYGSIICAWLNLYFKEYFGVYVDSLEESLFMKDPFYRAFIFYKSIFKNKHLNLARNNAKRMEYPVITYLGEDSYQLIINLIKHLLLVDLASKYHVIVRDLCFEAVFKLFAYTRGRVLLHRESELFTNEQFDLIRQLNSERRKQIGCHHLLRKIKIGTII